MDKSLRFIRLLLKLYSTITKLTFNMKMHFRGNNFWNHFEKFIEMQLSSRIVMDKHKNDTKMVLFFI